MWSRNSAWLQLAIVVISGVGTASGMVLAGANPFALWENGKPVHRDFFPIAVWLQSPENAGRYQDIGINLYVGLWQGPTQAQMNTLRKFNMPVICHQNEWAKQHLDEELIVAWMHGDEPDNAHRFKSYWAGNKDKIKAGWPEIYAALNLDTQPYQGYGPPVPPQWVINDYQAIKAVDSSRPVLVNLGQGVAWEDYIGRGERTGKLEDYPLYIRGCDIVSFDIYPACHSKPAVAQKLWYVPRGVDRLRQWAGPTKPVWTCIECTQINHPTTKATPVQIKCEVWMAIVHGARGLIYFAHTWEPRFIEAGLLADAQTAQAVREINAQVTALAPVLNSPSREGLVKVETLPGGGQVDIMVKQFEDALYIFAVEMQGQATRATLQIQDFRDAQAEVLGEDREFKMLVGRYTDDFDAWGVHLYKIE